MVDEAVLAAKIASVTDAVARIREVLPDTLEAFLDDRTAREVVTLNLFVALQECLSLAAHWLSDARWTVPATYGDVFTALADHDVIDRDLARRLVKAAGLRNLIAHRYGAVDMNRVYGIAAEDLEDFLTFCRILAQRACGSSA
jgi:uncharacterized protein YutE (UPF0331/DUF86 family)